MSDSDDKKTTPEIRFLVEQIANKINNSPVLNGGWDKMWTTIEHIKENQERIESKVDSIHDGLYLPKGLYSRVQNIEYDMQQFADRYKEHILSDEENMKHIDESLTKLSEKGSAVAKEAETTLKLKKIAGDDLRKLESVFEKKTLWQDRWNKIVWLIAGAATGGLVKVLIDFITK